VSPARRESTRCRIKLSPGREAFLLRDVSPAKTTLSSGSERKRGLMVLHARASVTKQEVSRIRERPAGLFAIEVTEGRENRGQSTEPFRAARGARASRWLSSQSDSARSAYPSRERFVQQTVKMGAGFSSSEDGATERRVDAVSIRAVFTKRCDPTGQSIARLLESHSRSVPLFRNPRTGGPPTSGWRTPPTRSSSTSESPASSQVDHGRADCGPIEPLDGFEPSPPLDRFCRWELSRWTTSWRISRADTALEACR